MKKSTARILIAVLIVNLFSTALSGFIIWPDRVRDAQRQGVEAGVHYCLKTDRC